MATDSGIRRHLRLFKNLSQELKESLVKTKADLSAVLAKMEIVRAKITSRIRRLLMSAFLVMSWVAAGQIYLLLHFWRTRGTLTD
jgi:hypothetical protein